MANILTNEEICEIGDIGDIVWLECYFDGNISLEPFMTDVSPYQDPVIINARSEIASSFPSETHENIIYLVRLGKINAIVGGIQNLLMKKEKMTING